MTRQTIAYQPALDGTRALAVTAVLLFHGGIGWMSGGYLGVSVFFTLSGYLITSLLLTEHERNGTINAAAFYTRRARRLLPASLVCIVGVCLMAWAGWFDGVASLKRDVLGAVFQVFNWVKLGSGESYADLTAAQAGFKKPLDHYWSLAIEEQFYWVWPLAFIGLLALARRRKVKPFTVVAVLTGVSALAAPVIAHVWGPNAAYWATPARICEILAGALVACWLHGREVPARLAALAPVSLVVLAVACVLFPDGHGPAYQGAMPLVAAVSAALILGLQAQGPARRLLATRPLVGLGKISYGVYLYHWPVYVLVERRGWVLPVGASLSIKCVITLVVAIASYYLIERPIRTASWMPPRRTLVAALGGTAIAAMVAVLVVPSPSKYYGVDAAAAEKAAIDTGPVEPLVPLATSTVAASVTTTSSPGGTGSTVVTPSTTVPAVTTTTELAVPPRPVRILVVGDSTAEATGAGIVEWAAAHPEFAQVEVAAGPGCGLVLGGYLELNTGQRDVDAECGPYVMQVVPDTVRKVHPDVVMVMSTVWDIQDRRLTKDGPLLSPTDLRVELAMTKSLGEFTDNLLALGVPRVVWVKAPVPLPSLGPGPDQQSQPARHEVLHRVIDDVVATRPAVREIDLAAWLAGQPVGTDREARVDGVHWTGEASLLIADEFLGEALVRAALS
ncbi:MAG: acyltransferase family protein [Ilumatobacteraceae bacterium]